VTEVIVVGGGLAGLVAARRLAATGIDTRLVERRGEVGGRVRSVRESGFVLDRGFQVLFTAYPAARRGLDYDALDLRRFTPGATIARPGARTVLADPRRDPGALTETLFNRDARLGDKLEIVRLWRELAGRSERETFAGPDASIAAYLADRGFSERFVERFLAPFYGGITLDRELSTSAAVFEFTFEMLAAGDIAVPAAGMGAIPAQLADAARAAGAEIALETEVEAVETTADGTTDGGSTGGEPAAGEPTGGVDGSETTGGEVVVGLGGETITVDAAVVATDPREARALTGVASIPTAARGCVTQYFSLPTGRGLETGKRLLLNARDAAPNQVAPLSAVAPEYAPDDRELLSATVLGTPEEDATALAERTGAALASWYPERRFEDLRLLHTDRLPFAQFAQPPGFYERLPAVDAPDGRVFLAGDYTRWSSIQGAMASGREAARAVRTALP
jgi:phytoene dehydrogenase-like protein